MSIFIKIKFRIIDLYYLVKDKVRNFIDTVALNIRYSSFISKLFSRLNHKTVTILIATYILFVIFQLILFSGLWEKPDVADLPEIKNYLSSYIFKYNSITQKIESRFDHYSGKLERYAKEISVPFHLNWIIDLQDRLNKEAGKNTNKDIKSFFVFNRHGRLMNFAPISLGKKKHLQINYMYTDYMKKIYQTLSENRESAIYFYADNSDILKEYDRKKGTHIIKSKKYICAPFIDNSKLKKSDDSIIPSPDNTDVLFDVQDYQADSIPYVMFFTPMFNQNNVFIGSGGFNVEIDQLFKDILEENNGTFQTLILNKEGFIQYSLNKKLIGKYVLFDKGISSLLKQDKEIIINENEKNIYLKHKIKQKDWYVISRINPEKPLFSFNNNPFHTFLLVIFFLFEAVVFALLFFLFKKHITQPIAKFSIGLRNLLKGDSMTKLEVNHHTEFKLIESRFNKLADRVKGYLIFGKNMSHELVDEYLEINMTGHIQTQEKDGTVLYIKVKNCEKLRMQKSKEDFDILMNKLYNDIEIYVTQYKGFIESFSSDSVIAIFGVPLNGYNHSQNGYECTTSIFKNLKKFNKVNKVNLQLSVSINTGEIFFSQMRSNYGKLFVSLGDTIRNAYYYESITKPFVLAISETTMNNLSPQPKVSKVLQLKFRDMEEEAKVYLQSK